MRLFYSDVHGFELLPLINKFALHFQLLGVILKKKKQFQTNLGMIHFSVNISIIGVQSHYQKWKAVSESVLVLNYNISRTWARELHLLVQYMKLSEDPRSFVNLCRVQGPECLLIISQINWKNRWGFINKMLHKFANTNTPSTSHLLTHIHTLHVCV